MKKKKKKLSLCLSVLIIGFLVGSSLNNNSLKALLEEKNNQYTIDSFDSSTWKWTATEVISDDNSDFSYVPSLAVDSAGSVHIAWESVDIGGTLADHKISYKYWDALTFSWTVTEIISTESSTGSFMPSIAADFENNLHVIWEDDSNYNGCGDDRDIFYKRWNASSSSWTTTEVVSTESTGYSRHTSLSIDSAGNIHVVWEDITDYGDSDGHWDIFYKMLDITTYSWTTTENIPETTTFQRYNPDISVDIKGNKHVVWMEFGTIDTEIHYTVWNVSTSTWSTSIDITTGIDFDTIDPVIDSDSQCNVHIVYAGNRFGTAFHIYYRQWNKDSGTWLTQEVISSESTGYSYYPDLFVDSLGNIHVAWHDESNYTNCGIDWDIHYKRWDISNSSWTITEVISTESSSTSYYPSLGVGKSGIIHITWQDWTDYAGAGTDEDIFYKTQIGPPVAPELAFIIPNPTELDTVYLDWNDVTGASSYYVYRSPSYIWSVEGIIPIATVSSSDYIDTVPSEGFYYYVIVAGNNAGNSSHSNCQYVEVKFTDLEAPELTPILPNPTDSDSISLVWDSIDGATEYYIYRSASYIWSVEALTPITTVGSTSYIDSLPSEGYYFYVIVANDGVRNSTHSNCEYVEYKVPHLREFSIVSGLILGVFVVSLVIRKTRKNKPKMN